VGLDGPNLVLGIGQSLLSIWLRGWDGSCFLFGRRDGRMMEDGRNFNTISYNSMGPHKITLYSFPCLLRLLLARIDQPLTPGAFTAHPRCCCWPPQAPPPQAIGITADAQSSLAAPFCPASPSVAAFCPAQRIELVGCSLAPLTATKMEDHAM
jgi:hypothetical protein